MDPRRDKLTDQIRKVILTSPWSRYAICKAVGMSQATMSRFINGHGGLSLDMLDRIADVLDLNIAAGTPHIPPKKQKTGPKPASAGGKGQ
jgi:transcriptional regulator with XRE-family HTH domain